MPGNPAASKPRGCKLQLSALPPGEESSIIYLFPTKQNPQFSKWSSLLIMHNSFCALIALVRIMLSQEWIVKYPIYSKVSDLGKMRQTINHLHAFSSSLPLSISIIWLPLHLRLMLVLWVPHTMWTHSPPKQSISIFKWSHLKHLKCFMTYVVVWLTVWYWHFIFALDF